MTHGAIARRYAGVLFDVTAPHGHTDKVLADLNAVTDLIAGHPQLRQVCETPIASPQKKRQVLEAVLAQSTGVSEEVKRLLFLLADRDRLSLLGAVTAAFTERVNQLKNIQPAHVVTAVPLGDTGRAALKAALGKAMGGDVVLHERVDPAIIGGVVARVGSVVFDGSVSRQIERLRERLATD